MLQFYDLIATMFMQLLTLDTYFRTHFVKNYSRDYL
jgi:hypothetical protein